LQVRGLPVSIRRDPIPLFLDAQCLTLGSRGYLGLGRGLLGLGCVVGLDGGRSLCVESLGHAWHTEGCRRALAGYSSWSPTHEAASAPIRRRKVQGHRRGDPQADGRRVHQRGIPSRMACQPCACEKERTEWHVRRFPTLCLASIKSWIPLLGAKPCLSSMPTQGITKSG
jgi:hypothetical protein